MFDLHSKYKILEELKFDCTNFSYYKAVNLNKNLVIIKTLKNNSNKGKTPNLLKLEYNNLKKIELSSALNTLNLEKINKNFYLSYEYFEGELLSKYIKRNKIEIDIFLDLAINLSTVIQQLHQNETIHNNINPHSILIDPQSLNLKITNFAFATNFDTQTNNFYNKTKLQPIAYISPEQTGRTKHTVDYRSDFYSLGIVLYEILAKKLPFSDREYSKIIYSHLAQTPIDIHQINSQIFPAISSIVMKLLAKNPEDRYQSAYAIKADLENCKIQYQNNKTIKPFNLGKLDRCSNLTISSKLYGRELAIDSLLTSIKKAYSGKTELVLISGELGFGKTSLIEQTIEPIIKNKGFFIKGKFEPSTINIPYQAIRQAFDIFIQQLLTQNNNIIKEWQQKIATAVGINGKVITDIVPEIESIIGSQPNIVKLSAKETENRFNIIFIEFIKTFISKNNPLILFFDDLQWADSASLNLLNLIVDSLPNEYLLVIWAYQEQKKIECSCHKNKVFSDYTNLRCLLENIKAKDLDININQIVLKPLNIEQVSELLVDSFSCKNSESRELAELLLKRTKGNPFFINQFIKNIYQEKLLFFDFHTSSWKWKLQEIEDISIVDFSLLKLIDIDFKNLDDESQKILKLAACIGNHFEIKTLATLCEKSERETTRIIKIGEAAGIIFLLNKKSDTVYKFVHNRVHQNIYFSLEEKEKIYTHFQIGKLLLEQNSSNVIEDKIFSVVNHFNIGKKLLSNSSLTNRVAKLNFIAAKKAKSAIAYEVAANYLEMALELISPSAWKNNYDLIFNIYAEAIEVRYLLTDFKAAKHLANIALKLAQKTLDKVKINEIKIHAYIACNQMELAIDEGLEILEMLGKPVFYKQSQEEKLTTLFEKNDFVKDIENLPEMTDEYSLAAIKTMITIIPPAYMIKFELFLSLVSKMIELCLQKGNSRFSAYVYGTYGLFLCASGNIDLGYQLGNVSLKMQEKFEGREIAPKTNFIFNNMIRHWKEPAVNTINHLLEGINDSIEVGDIEYACFNAKYYCTYLFFIGESLSFIEDKNQYYINLIRSFKQNFQLKYTQIWQQLNHNLQGLTNDYTLLIGKDFNESRMLPVWQKENNGTCLFALYLAKLILCYFSQDYKKAVLNANEAEKYIKSAAGTICFSMYYFYTSLAILAMYSSKNNIEPKCLDRVVSYQKQLKKWANHAPDNYKNKYYLITAEKARVLREIEQAAENYDLAITTAAKAGYAHEVSIAEELTAKFYLSQGKTRIAEYYLTDAYNGYVRWGVLIKAEVLKSEYIELLTRVDVREFNNSANCQMINSQDENSKLDLFSLIKASQAISSEIILDNLLSKIMNIVMENAGAQKTILLLQQNSSWNMAALATITPTVQVQLPYLSINECSELPNSIFNYVQSTRKAIILEQADKESIFTNDPYIIENKAKSILACPMIYKDELQGIIYLENCLIKGAFTTQTLDIIKVLLSQVSISIENARLYKNLKDHSSVKKSLKQKEILLKEIHHRVKNNLLVVSSLLELQSSYIDDSKILKMLENCQNRIYSMALVHQHLYGNKQLNKVNFAQYIDSLVMDIAYSQATKERNINFVRNLDSIELNIETANPCGLIVNELISNALEHGFKNRSEGNIWLSLKHNLEDEIILTIQDDGIGLGDNFDIQNNNSLGLELVCTLIEQIEGKLELDRKNGTKFEIVFKELNYEKRI